MLSSIARQALRRAHSSQVSRAFATSGFPAPRLFDYETVTSNLSVTDAIESVEEAFAALAKGKVDVPMPMHIGIEESSVAGPGDCHIKGGYVSATPTFTVKLACVSFYKNLESGLPPGSGIFIVVNAVSMDTKRSDLLLYTVLVPYPIRCACISLAFAKIYKRIVRRK